MAKPLRWWERGDTPELIAHYVLLIVLLLVGWYLGPELW